QRRFSDQENANGYGFAGFLPDGRVLSMNRAGKARIWKPDAPDTPPDAETPVGDAYGAWLSPNGSYVAWYNSSANEIWGWDFRQQRASERLAKVNYGSGNTAFSRDGQLLAIPAEDGGFATWDVARRSVIRRFAGHFGLPDSYAFSPVDDRLVSGSYYPESEV